MSSRAGILQRSPVGRLVHARPRIFIAMGLAALVWIALQGVTSMHPVTRTLIAWNVGTMFYVILAAIMMVRSSESRMRRRAKFQDDGQLVLLVLVVVTSVASLVAIAAELAVVKDMHGLMKLAHMCLAGITVMCSWAFIQVMFSLHYAHEYYAGVQAAGIGGLDFPNDTQPVYGDFFYFAAVIGTSGQTADISFTSKQMRRIGTLHCILSYLFNTVVLALLINIGASLL
jgi:uncharacterized membrane protein